jgi:hypothetical protein
MADTIKDSFNEAANHVKVIFQRGRDVCDFELNEFQDVLRVLAVRAIFTAAQQTVAATGNLSPGSSDDGFKITAAGGEVVQIGTGFLLADGHSIRQADASAAYTLSPAWVAGTETVRVFLAVQETEIADPAQLPQLGETTRRRVLQWTIGNTVNAAIPVSSSDELWAGGTKTYLLATITRTSNVVADGDIVDERKLLPASLMAEVTRQVDFKVKALVSTILETPDGVLLPKAKLLTVDVDPDGSLGPDGVFQVRFNRDGDHSEVALAVNHLGDGDTRLESPLSPMQFRDYGIAGTESVSGEAYVPLTGPGMAEGDQYLRLGGIGIKNTTETRPPSIFKMINGRWCITVGDGNKTFGDFNGADGLIAAVAWWKNYLTVATQASCVIQVKAGTYNLDLAVQGLGFAGEATLTIEGTGGLDVTLRNNTSGPGITSDHLCCIHLKGVRVTRGSTGTVGVYTSGRVVLEDCIFVDQTVMPSISVVGVDFSSGRVSAWRSSFVATSSSACVCLENNCIYANAEAFGYVFRDCLFDTSGASCAPVEVRETVLATNPAVLRGVRFEQCKFLLGTTTATAGNPTTNVGVLGLYPWTGHAGNTLLHDITFAHCFVTANAMGGVGTLLFLPQNGTGDYIDIGTLAIRGGQWKVTASSSITPFTLGLPSAASAAPRVRQIVLDDVLLGYEGTSSVDYGEGPAVTGWNGTSGALFILSTPHLVMRNVHFPTCVMNGRSGEMLCAAETFDVNGVYALDWVYTTNIATPHYRVAFQSALWAAAKTYKGSIRNVVFEKTPGAGGVACDWGVFLLRPNGKLTLVDCTARGFTTTATHRGFYVLDATADSPTFLTSGITLDRCEASDMGGDGFHFYDGGANVGTVALDRLVIRGSRFCDNAGNGINIRGDHSGAHPKVMGSVLLQGNVCEGNTGVGINYQPATWTSSEEGPTLIGNVCKGNGTYEVQLGQAGAEAYTGVFHGNDLGVSGKLSITLTSWGVNGPRGAETGYVVTGAPPSTIGQANREFTSAEKMIHNVGVLDI